MWFIAVRNELYHYISVHFFGLCKYFKWHAMCFYSYLGWKKDNRMIIPKVKESYNFRKPINANRWTWKFNDNKMTFILSNRRWMTQFNIRLPKADQGERWKDTVQSSRWIGSVVQFYAWFKFYFPLIQNHYHTLQYPKKKKKKVKFEPRTKSNHDIGATTKPNRNKQFCPWIEECNSHLKINEKKISSVAQHGKLHYPWKKIYTKKENGGIKKNIWSQNI